MFRNKLEFYGAGLLAPPPNPQAGGPPPVGCPRLLIQYIRSYPPYLEAVFSIRNLRTHHAVVTEDPLNFCSVGICNWINFIFCMYQLYTDYFVLFLYYMSVCIFSR
jgi:hypothetical protein